MGKKTDEKILDLLKKRVIERDNELESKEYLSATKEALIELTSLSAKEVDAIYNDAKAEVLKEEKERQKIISKVLLYGAGVLLILALVYGASIIEYFRSPVSFTDNFDKNSNNWNFTDKMGNSQFIENGAYIIDSYKEKTKIEFITQDFSFPKNFSIETEIKKISGEENNCGIYLGTDNVNFAYFFINPTNGQYKLYAAVNGKVASNSILKESKHVHKRKNAVNTIKVQVTGNLYEYYINGNLVEKGNLFNLKLSQFYLATVGTQKIAFDNLKIVNSDNKEVLFSNTFDKEIEPWVNNLNVLKKAEFKSGNYQIATNDDNFCYWSETWIPENFKSINQYEIKLDAKILELQDNAVMGFMLLKDDENYLSFEVKEGRMGRIVVVKNKLETFIGNYSVDKKNENGKVNLRIIKKKNEVEFFFNGLLVDKVGSDKWYDWNKMEKMGLRVCGIHTVGFENLEFKEIK